MAEWLAAALSVLIALAALLWACATDLEESTDLPEHDRHKEK